MNAVSLALIPCRVAAAIAFASPHINPRRHTRALTHVKNHGGETLYKGRMLRSGHVSPGRSRANTANRHSIAMLLTDKILKPAPARVGSDIPAKQGSSSFLKKRTKKLLLCWLTRPARSVRMLKNKSFLVLFFKKELLPLRST
jgi:hypothetical protein